MSYGDFNKYNRMSVARDMSNEIFEGIGEFQANYEGLESYRDLFKVYHKNKHEKIVNFVDNLLNKKFPMGCKLCTKKGISLSCFNSCFLYNRESCDTLELTSIINEDDKRFIFSVQRNNDKIIGKLELEIDSTLEGGPII